MEETEMKATEASAAVAAPTIAFAGRPRAHEGGHRGGELSTRSGAARRAPSTTRPDVPTAAVRDTSARLSTLRRRVWIGIAAVGLAACAQGAPSVEDTRDERRERTATTPEIAQEHYGDSLDGRILDTVGAPAN